MMMMKKNLIICRSSLVKSEIKKFKATYWNVNAQIVSNLNRELEGL